MNTPATIQSHSQEIEAKFLLCENGRGYRLPLEAPELGTVEQIRTRVARDAVRLEQGYIPESQFAAILGELGISLQFRPKEIRLRNFGGELLLTAKGKGTLVREEYEISIPAALFDQYWPSTDGRRVLKRRWKSSLGQNTLEIDDYIDRDLLIAEVTLPDEDAYKPLPKIGKDVTRDKAYKNKNMGK